MNPELLKPKSVAHVYAQALIYRLREQSLHVLFLQRADGRASVGVGGWKSGAYRNEMMDFSPDASPQEFDDAEAERMKPNPFDDPKDPIAHRIVSWLMWYVFPWLYITMLLVTIGGLIYSVSTHIFR